MNKAGIFIFLICFISTLYSQYILLSDKFSSSGDRVTSSAYILNGALGQNLSGKSSSSNYIEMAGLYHMVLPMLITGDVNGDGKVDVHDIEYLAKYLYYQGPAPEPFRRGDLNKDNAVDDKDLVNLSKKVLQTGKSPISQKPFLKMKRVHLRDNMP